MFLTRLGFGSKMVVTGDVTQIDLPQEQASGLVRVSQILAAIDGIEFVESATRTWSATCSSSGSSRRTSGTPRRRAASGAGDPARGRERERRGRGRGGGRGEVAPQVLAREGVDEGDLGIAFAGPRRCAQLKREHLGSTRPRTSSPSRSTGATSCPRRPAPARGRRPCPQVVGEAWRAPLVHGLLHLLGYEHGAEMERRERARGMTVAVAPPAPPILQSFN